MRLITDYLGRNEDGSWKEIKSVPPMVTIYLTDPYTEEEHEFDIITSEWNLND